MPPGHGTRDTVTRTRVRSDVSRVIRNAGPHRTEFRKRTLLGDALGTGLLTAPPPGAASAFSASTFLPEGFHEGCRVLGLPLFVTTTGPFLVAFTYLAKSAATSL